MPRKAAKTNYRDLPDSRDALLNASADDIVVDGDYLVCPFIISRPGRMQFVRIEKASHIFHRATGY